MKSEVVNNLMCEFGDLIVPYLYGESTEPERSRFETHMLDCSMCADEFAEISFSRYSVFEWQKEEFAQMPTPQIVIPYDVKYVKSVGFFDGFREFLFFNWASKVTVAAAFLIIAGIGFVTIDYFNQPVEQIASVDESNSNSSMVRPVSLPNKTEAPKVITVKKIDSPDDSIETPRSVRASLPQRRKPVTAYNNAPRKPLHSESPATSLGPDLKAPALTADTVDDDKSLRLADLFDTVDTLF